MKIFNKKTQPNKDILIDLLINNLSTIQVNNIIRNINNYINYTIDNKNLNNKYNIKNNNKLVLYLKQKLELSLINKSNINQENNFVSTMQNEKKDKSKKEEKQ